MVTDLGVWDCPVPNYAQWKQVVLERIPNFHITSLDVRSPDYDPHLNVFKFHQDCGGTDAWMVVWASCSPTEILYHITEAKHIYLFKNREHFHRAPENLGRDRWFCRAVGQCQ